MTSAKEALEDSWQRRQKTRYKTPQLVAQHCFVASVGSVFLVFHLAWSTYRATKTIVAGWRNTACWLVDLLGVASFMKNEQQSQNLLLKVEIALYFSQQLSSTRNKNICCVKSWSRKVKNTKRRPKSCSETSCATSWAGFWRISYFTALIIILRGFVL